VTGEYTYQPFGATTLTGTDAANPTRFAGRDDDGSGLYYNRARYYSVGDQRFLSQDPLGYASGDTDLYAYVTNQPTNLTDPFGTKPETLYRAMSDRHFAALERTGMLSPTGETFTSPTQSFSEDYDGQLVKFNLATGTLAALEAVGVRDDSPATEGRYPNMPRVSAGWNRRNAFFKGEGPQINIGLGRGPGLQIFNEGIVSYDHVQR
jgi:RHS repeat-associated protein